MVRPILDRVLLRRIKEKPQIGTIVQPDAYHEDLRYTVVELGDFVIVAGQRYQQTEFVNVGDVVLVHLYDVEDISVDGETLHLTRMQCIKGRERKANAKSRATQGVPVRISGSGERSRWAE